MKPKIDSIESERLVLETRRESHANELYELFCESNQQCHFLKKLCRPWISISKISINRTGRVWAPAFFILMIIIDSKTSYIESNDANIHRKNSIF